MKIEQKNKFESDSAAKWVSHTIAHSQVVVMNSYFCKQNQNRACVAKSDYNDFPKIIIYF